MAIPLDPKQVVSFEELLMSQVVQQEALTRLLVEKGIFTKEEFLAVVKAVNDEMKRKEAKIIEGGYFYEVYINNCFVEWSGFVDSFFLCYGAKGTSHFRRGKIIKHGCSGKWHQGEFILCGKYFF